MVELTARGLMAAVFTSLNDDQTINFAVIEPYAKYLVDSGFKSILVGGTTGEHVTFNVETRKRLIAEWLRVGKAAGLHVMVHVGGASLADVKALAAYCQSAGADSLLTLPELYFKPSTVDELVSYVRLVASAAPKLPVVYYHNPKRSKVEINMPAFATAATARIPNFRGIKFSSSDLSEGVQVSRALEHGQQIFIGTDTLLAPAALLGITSGMGSTYSLFPGLVQDILAAAVENEDVAKARALQEKLSLAIEALTAEGAWVPVMKVGMEIITGLKMGPPALPQKPISLEARKRIEGKLRVMGFAK